MESVFKPGDIVLFDMCDTDYDTWKHCGYPNVGNYHSRKAKVLKLNTYFELGDKNAEYYDIQFLKDEVVYEAVSGYHLTIATNRLPKGTPLTVR